MVTTKTLGPNPGEKTSPRDASLSAMHDDTETVNSTLAPLTNPADKRTERVDSPAPRKAAHEPNDGEKENAKTRQASADSDNDPPSAPSDAQVEKIAQSDAQKTRNVLSAQDKLLIVLTPPKDGEYTHEQVTINGFTTQIERGKPVQVSRSVYEVLVAAGKIPPQTEADMSLVPQEVQLAPRPIR